MTHLHFNDKYSAPGMLFHLVFCILLFSYFLLLAKTEDQCHTTLLKETFLQKGSGGFPSVDQTSGFPSLSF